METLVFLGGFFLGLIFIKALFYKVEETQKEQNENYCQQHQWTINKESGDMYCIHCGKKVGY